LLRAPCVASILCPAVVVLTFSYYNTLLEI